jgi:hypothetical protein
MNVRNTCKHSNTSCLSIIVSDRCFVCYLVIVCFCCTGIYKYSPFTDKGRHKKYPQIFANVMNPNYHVARPTDVDLELLDPSESNGRMR